MRKAENPRSRNAPRDSEQLSGPWIIAGSVLFIAALTAPVTVVHMGRDLGPQASLDASDEANKPVLSETRQIVAGTGTGNLRTKLADGQIVPGSGVGDVRLGQNIDEVIASIQEPSALHFGTEVDGMSQSHVFDLDDLRVVLRSDPDIGRIEEMGIAALDCKSVRTFQPRQEGLPATADGLSIGSHVSRVVKRMGPPNAEMPGEPVPAMRDEHLRHSYPGLTLRYCPEDMVVGAISVEAMPEKPSDNVPLIAMVEPNAPSVQDLPNSQAGVTISADGKIASAAPADLTAGAGALEPATSEGIASLGEDRDVAIVAPPAPLLAMNGDGFAVTDAFSPGALSRPEAAVRRRALYDDASLTRVPGAGEQPDIVLALASEAGLELGRAKRREIQIRLDLLGFSPRGADGIFGPRTREAIAKMQEAAELPTTGYLDGAAMAYVEDRSAQAYARWRARQAKKRDARASVQPVLASRVPSARNAPECARDQSGQIIENQSWSCDVTVLEESLSSLFGGLGSGPSS